MKKNEGLVIILSFLIPGLGQIYCGKIGRGLCIFVGVTATLCILVGFVGYVWQIFDARKCAREVNK